MILVGVVDSGFRVVVVGQQRRGSFLLLRAEETAMTLVVAVMALKLSSKVFWSETNAPMSASLWSNETAEAGG